MANEVLKKVTVPNNHVLEQTAKALLTVPEELPAKNVKIMEKGDNVEDKEREEGKNCIKLRNA